MIDPGLQKLIAKEPGWEIKVDPNDGQEKIYAFGSYTRITHPAVVYLKHYRLETNPDRKYFYMKAAHDYLWPKDIKTYHYWTERRFRAHCEGHPYMSWAGCAASGKSYDAAKVVVLWWLANPRHRAAMIASTTLTAVSRRIWGYAIKHLNNLAVKMPYVYTAGNSPQVLYPVQKDEEGGKKGKDTLHGIFAAAAKQGDDESAISGFLGTHPDEALLLILDEATDLPVALLNALANLKSSEKPFQLIAIGNSNSIHDLHGALSTPKDGWPQIDPKATTRWETTYKGGICLYFNAYESPAIFEQDPVKKKILSPLLPTENTIKAAEETYGKDSINFYRFTLGFWRSASVDSVVMSKEFLIQHNLQAGVEWLGMEPLKPVAGLDPAFSTGGDKCILRLGYLGQDINGNMVLDFKGERLLFEIKISAVSRDSAELQISRQVVEILRKYGVPLHHLCLDASGQGRALGGTLALQDNSGRQPIKIYTVRTGSGVDKSFDVIPKTKHELWLDFRKFSEHGNIKGLDGVAAAQFYNRLVIQNPKTLRQEIESKVDFKKRIAAIMPTLAHSPDEADACTLCLQAAIINFGFSPGQKREVPTASPSVIQEIAQWKAGVRAVQQEHTTGVMEYPKADFKSGLVLPKQTI